MMEKLMQQMDFILEVDKLKKIGRQTYISDASRKENDAEHSWHLAIMAYLLREYANDNVDVLKVIMMVLIHDLVEIDAGDTYAYDTEANKTKASRELAAAKRIFGLLPKEQGDDFMALWQEFEAGETMEAKYAGTLDKIQPLMLNNATGGKSWKEHSVKYESVTNRFSAAKEGSDAIWEYGQSMIDKNRSNGKLL